MVCNYGGTRATMMLSFSNFRWELNSLMLAALARRPAEKSISRYVRILK
jgi:hypothetical protein